MAAEEPPAPAVHTQSPTKVNVSESFAVRLCTKYPDGTRYKDQYDVTLRLAKECRGALLGDLTQVRVAWPRFWTNNGVLLWAPASVHNEGPQGPPKIRWAFICSG